jgi:SAM-dependent methyltransferase
MSEERDRPPIASAHDELRRTYARYEAGRATLWAGAEIGAQLATAERDAWLVDALSPIAGGNVVDLGCGDANLARTLSTAGVAVRYVGIELLAVRVQEARQRSPDARLVQASALQLPLRDASADAVVAATLVSSLPAPWLRRALSDEIRRVLMRGGRLVVYDLRYASPGNPNVRRVSKGELLGLLPGWPIIASTTLTVLPPLARSRFSAGRLRYGMLSRVPLLRSHIGVVLEKPR